MGAIQITPKINPSLDFCSCSKQHSLPEEKPNEVRVAVLSQFSSSCEAGAKKNEKEKKEVFIFCIKKKEELAFPVWHIVFFAKNIFYNPKAFWLCMPCPISFLNGTAYEDMPRKFIQL